MVESWVEGLLERDILNPRINPLGQWVGTRAVVPSYKILIVTSRQKNRGDLLTYRYLSK